MAVSLQPLRGVLSVHVSVSKFPLFIKMSVILD